jgi:hypothetical protein
MIANKERTEIKKDGITNPKSLEQVRQVTTREGEKRNQTDDEIRDNNYS